MIRILQGDCREVMRTLPENSVDAIVTDPPYHLTTGKKGGSGEASVSLKTPHGRARVTTGFMGMEWDGGDVAMRRETWAEALRVLKPGGFLVAFGGTRTYHRMACAIEDAGFEYRDMLAWLYGSGFPKGTDKAKIPAEWAGWNTALKPALEPVSLARKPMDGTLAENLRKWGTGALWIDGCRIGDDVVSTHSRGANGAFPKRPGEATPEESGRRKDQRDGLDHSERHGRWPANVLHDGSDEVLAAFPDAPGQIADASSSSSRKNQAVYGAMKRGNESAAQVARGDTGSAARFFYCAKADRADRNAGLDGMPEKPLLWSSGEQNPGAFQSPNTKRAAQNHHPTVKPTELMRWLCRLVTPPGGLVLDPFMGSGSTLKAAELEGFSGIGIELNPEYIAIARRRIAADAPLFAQVES